MRTRIDEETSYRTRPIEQAIARLATKSIWQRTSLSSYVSGGLILFLTTFSILFRYEISPDPLEVEYNSFGDPEAAIERIAREHFISVRELEERTQDPTLDHYDRLALEHSPLILDETYSLRLEQANDVPIGVYYTYSVSTYGEREVVHIEYWMHFSDESVGMSSEERMARWGHPLDRELIYRLNILDGEIFGAEYQAPIHRLVRFQYPEGGRPIFRIASANHNFQLVHPMDRPQLQPDTEIIAPLPQYELAESPLTDPDILALAAREAILQHNVDMTRYVYVAIQDPAYVLREPYPAEVDVGVLTRNRWEYLHSRIGRGVRVFGHRVVAIDVGFTPQRGDIDDVKLILHTTEPSDRPGLRIARVYVYTDLRIPA